MNNEEKIKSRRVYIYKREERIYNANEIVIGILSPS